jgi:hypothetical protein
LNYWAKVIILTQPPKYLEQQVPACQPSGLVIIGFFFLNLFLYFGGAFFFFFDAGV